MTNPLVRATRKVEHFQNLDVLDHAVRPLVTRLLTPGAANVLRGDWLGHAVHPALTDVPLGMWMSGTLLDFVGGRSSAPAARRLIGIGVLAAAPTAITGWAEWAAIDSPRDRRTGLLHAEVNALAIGLYAASWRARTRGDRGRGTVLAVVGGLVATVGGYFGGHLTAARKVSSRHPSFETD